MGEARHAVERLTVNSVFPIAKHTCFRRENAMTAIRLRPNVLLITCDQWRGDSLSAAGHPIVQTPNVDALAKEATRHYAGASPCSPARACIYTGLYQMTNRVCRNGSPMDGRFDNLALAMRRLGYDPTLFGYTDVSPDPRLHAAGDPVLRSYEGVLPGFSTRQLLPEHQKQWLSWLRMRGLETPAGFPEIHQPLSGRSGDVSRAPPVYSADETPTAFLTDEFVRWLGEQSCDQPWFAHISFISPHPPFIAPEPFNEMFDAAGGKPFARHKTWQEEARQHPYVAHELDNQKRKKFLPGAKGKVRDLSDNDFRTIRAIYWGMIAEVDRQLGRIWQALRDAGAWGDTVIVLTSDHGEMMGDHFMLGKGGFFDQSYHLPLIVRDPRETFGSGRRIDAFTEAVDIMPTIIELAGGEPGVQLDGRSLKPLLGNEGDASRRDAAHWEFDYRNMEMGPQAQLFGLRPEQCNLAVLRTAAHKYVHFGGGLPPLLFDLNEDPGELRNLAQEPAAQALRLEMAERMLAWRAEHLDRSLSFSALTEQGIAGAFAPKPRR
jgi:arylsulfatase A-like enzyme